MTGPVEEEEAGPPPQDGLIRLQNARAGWRGRRGREGFSLALPSYALAAGEAAALIGPSGGGKSTLLALLAGAAPPRPGSGPAMVAGQDLRALSGPARDRLRADEIGMIFQLFNLLPAASVRDNVLLPLSFSRKRRARIGDPTAEARRLLDALGLPATLDGAPAGTLSVGQQQRVAAARALIGGPRLILADEPTSALDPEARDSFLALLFEEARRAGAGLLLVTHDPAVAERFERIDRLTDIARTTSAVGATDRQEQAAL